MTSPPDDLDPGLLAQLGDEAAAALRAYIRQLDRERSSAAAALRALTRRPPGRGPRGRPDGTYTMLRAYLAQLREEGYAGDITSGAAAEWMLARGWVTAGPDPRKAVSQALGTLARWGEELVQVRYGRYQQPGEREDG